MREISIYDGHKPLPGHGCSFLTSAPQAPVPRFDHKVSEAFQGLDVSRYAKVLPVTQHNEYSGESVPPIPGESVPLIPRQNVPPVPRQSVPPFEGQICC